MSENLKFIVSVLFSSGIVSFVGWLLKKRIATGIENSIKNKYDKKIENLKSELSISQSISANSLSAQSEGLKATHIRRLDAIDLYWKNILEIEKLAEPLNYFDAFSTKEEIEKINNHNSNLPNKFQKTISTAFKRIDEDKMAEFSNDKKSELEKLRPYIGEDLWLLRFYFNLFIGRILYQYSTEYENGENLTHWTKDEHFTKTLNETLTIDEQNFIYKAKFGGIDKGINVFKQKILNEISKTTSGVLVGKSSIENAIVLSKLMSGKE
jgi:hypothetical protein